jgi:hypothetical protein
MAEKHKPHSQQPQHSHQKPQAVKPTPPAAEPEQDGNVTEDPEPASIADPTGDSGEASDRAELPNDDQE